MFAIICDGYHKVAFADVIILNKMDAISGKDASAVKKRIRSINKSARLHPAIQAKVKIDVVMNIGAFDLVRTRR